MDRLYIPNYSVTLPGTDDVFWVYGGKGTENSSERRFDGIDRKCSSMHTTNPRTAIRDSYLHLANSCVNVLHPAEVIEPLNPNYNESNTLDFLAGFDLLNNEKFSFLQDWPIIGIFQNIRQSLYLNVHIQMDLHLAMFWKRLYVMRSAKS